MDSLCFNMTTQLHVRLLPWQFRLSVCLSVCLMMIEVFRNIFTPYWLDYEKNKVSTTVFFQISLDCHTIIMNTCIFDSFGRDVCVCLC